MESFIAAYNNDPVAENLCKLIASTFACKFVVLGWQVGDSSWYIPAILDLHIDDCVNTNDTVGWYIQEELTIKTVPVRHIKLKHVIEIKAKSAKLIFGYDTEVTVSIELFYHFAVTAWLDKLQSVNLLARQKLRQELMLSNISHSIRTPLNGILHMTKTVMSSNLLGVNKELDETLNYLNQSAVSLATNIFDIIDLTKLELGKLTLVKDVFNIRDMLANTIELANTLNKASVDIHFHIDNSVPEYIYSDVKRIKQILINLLENALQHTHTGEITVYVSATIINLASEDKQEPHHLVDYQYLISFTIKDTGVGMDAIVKNNLFKPLEEPGAQQGLSLRISYLLAKILNGDLSLLASEPGHGSCFEFQLIACEEEPPTIYSRTLRDLKNKSVLLLDDTNNHVNVCKVFERYKMKYTLASTYDEVAVLHADKEFDLLIVKSTSGTNLIRAVKTLFDKPVLYISDTQVRLADFYLTDDCDEAEIKSKLLDIFNGRQEIATDQTRIMIVEDERINRIVMEKLLRNMGFKHITIANNGEIALNLYNKNPDLYDILLIDIRMPLMSGFELADKIYAINPAAKMIGITAQITCDEELKPWFNEFVYKPINSDELLKKINKLI